MTIIGIAVPASFRPDKYDLIALQCGLSASKGLSKINKQDREDLALFQKTAECGVRATHSLYTGQSLPTRKKGSNLVAFKAVDSALPKDKRELYQRSLEAIVRAESPLAYIHLDWVMGQRINEPLAEFEREALALATRTGLVPPPTKQEVDELIAILARARSEYAAIQSVTGGHFYVRRGHEGQLQIRSIAELPAKLQKEYEQLRLDKGLGPRITEEELNDLKAKYYLEEQIAKFQAA